MTALAGHCPSARSAHKCPCKRSLTPLGRAGPKMSEFRKHLASGTPQSIEKLRGDVEEFAKQFATIGFEKDSMRYKE